MPGTAVINSGNYTLEVDTGFIQDAFTLDSATQGVLDNTTFVLNGTTDFADVTDGVNVINVRRGRRDVGDQFSAGTMTFTMLDTTGVFNPFDTDSPYYDPTLDQPGLAPMRRVQLARYSDTNVKEYLFKGVIVNYNYNFALGGLDTVTVYCADDFYLLAQTYLDEFNVTEQLSSERLSAVLDLPEVNYPATRDIATGTQTLGGAAAFTVPQGTNVLAYCSQINEAEQGRLFISRDGDLTFDARLGSTLDPAVADFHDDGTNFKYNGVGVTFEADQVTNRAVVQILGSNNPQSADNAGSQSKYFVQTYSITDSLLHNDAAALTLALYLLDPEPEARYTSLNTEMMLLTTAQKDVVATLEIGDTIAIEKTFTSGASTTQLAQNLSIEGIEHTISVDRGHAITLFTAPTIVVYELILDDTTYGTMDSDNVLGT